MRGGGGGWGRLQEAAAAAVDRQIVGFQGRRVADLAVREGSLAG